MRTSLLAWARRRRVLPLGAFALAGMLVGSLLTAWQTDDLPRATLEESACWDTVRAEDITEIYEPGYEYRAETLSTQDIVVNKPKAKASGFCDMLVSREDGGELRPSFNVTVSVRQLYQGHDEETDSRVEDWYRKYLIPESVPFGKGVTGMTSFNRSWIALPRKCLGGGSFPLGGPTIVTVHSTANPNFYRGDQSRQRTARLNVQAANHVMDQMDCQAKLPMPERLPEQREYGDSEPDAYCGVPGLRIPRKTRAEYRSEMTTELPGTLRICGNSDVSDDIRLITLEDPWLAKLYEFFAEDAGRVAVSTVGRTVVGGDFAMFETTQCGRDRGEREIEFSEEKEHTAFLVIDGNVRDGSVAGEMLPRYAAAEGKRLGCAQFDVAMPD